MNDWLRVGDGRITLTLHIQPGAKKTEVAGIYGDALKIRLDVSKSAVIVKSGQTSRRKVLELSAAPVDAVQRLLGGMGQVFADIVQA